MHELEEILYDPFLIAPVKIVDDDLRFFSKLFEKSRSQKPTPGYRIKKRMNQKAALAIGALGSRRRDSRSTSRRRKKSKGRKGSIDSEMGLGTSRRSSKDSSTRLQKSRPIYDITGPIFDSKMSFGRSQKKNSKRSSKANMKPRKRGEGGSGTKKKRKTATKKRTKKKKKSQQEEQNREAPVGIEEIDINIENLVPAWQTHRSRRSASRQHDSIKKSIEFANKVKKAKKIQTESLRKEIKSRGARSSGQRKLPELRPEQFRKKLRLGNLSTSNKNSKGIASGSTLNQSVLTSDEFRLVQTNRIYPSYASKSRDSYGLESKRASTGLAFSSRDTLANPHQISASWLDSAQGSLQSYLYSASQQQNYDTYNTQNKIFSRRGSKESRRSYQEVPLPQPRSRQRTPSTKKRQSSYYTGLVSKNKLFKRLGTLGARTAAGRPSRTGSTPSKRAHQTSGSLARSGNKMGIRGPVSSAIHKMRPQTGRKGYSRGTGVVTLVDVSISSSESEVTETTEESLIMHENAKTESTIVFRKMKPKFDIISKSESKESQTGSMTSTFVKEKTGPSKLMF